jgi:hypothetical protein
MEDLLMSKKDLNGMTPKEEAFDEISEEEFDDLELLERLESLREDMEELGISTLAELILRIEEMHKRLDAQ